MTSKIHGNYRVQRERLFSGVPFAFRVKGPKHDRQELDRYLDHLWEQARRPEVQEKLRNAEPAYVFRRPTA